jgi:RNA processing factor Prp31
MRKAPMKLKKASPVKMKKKSTSTNDKKLGKKMRKLANKTTSAAKIDPRKRKTGIANEKASPKKMKKASAMKMKKVPKRKPRPNPTPKPVRKFTSGIPPKEKG